MTTTAPRAAATARRIRDQRAEDTRRAAIAAEAAGVRILVERLTGQHIATDPAAPFVAFAVGVEGCTCKHFGVWGRCGHHALLLAELGAIEDTGEDELIALAWRDADPDPAPTARPLARQYLYPRSAA